MSVPSQKKKTFTIHFHELLEVHIDHLNTVKGVLLIIYLGEA